MRLIAIATIILSKGKAMIAIAAIKYQIEKRLNAIPIIVIGFKTNKIDYCRCRSD